MVVVVISGNRARNKVNIDVIKSYRTRRLETLAERDTIAGYSEGVLSTRSEGKRLGGVA